MDELLGNDGKEPPIKGHENNLLSSIANEPGLHEKRPRLLPWLIGGLCIFAVLYGTSYLALFWLPPFEGVDLRSQLTADYSAWEFLAFQPIDPAVIEELRLERELPEQIIIDGSFWPTSNNMNITPWVASVTPVSTILVTSESPLSSTTAAQSSYTSTPIPTSIILTPEPVATLQGIESSVPMSAPDPTRTSKPRKTAKPEKTSKPPKDPKH